MVVRGRQLAFACQVRQMCQGKASWLSWRGKLSHVGHGLHTWLS